MTTISSLNEVYQPFMVDCETIGTIPNTAPVLQIAVVSFDPDTFEPTDELTVYLPLNEQIAAGKTRRTPTFQTARRGPCCHYTQATAE